MPTALRPMSTGELLDRCFNLYRNNFPLFAGIAALAAIILVVGTVLLTVLGVGAIATGAQFNPGAAVGGLVIYFIVFMAFYLIAASLATGATIYAVSKVHLGQLVTIGESYNQIFPWVGRIIRIVFSIGLRMIGVFLLLYLVVFVLTVVMVGGIAASGARGAGAVGAGALLVILMVGMVMAAYVIAIRVYLKYSLAVQACLLEKAEAGQSLQRSAFLTKGSLGRIFLIYLLMGVIALILMYVLNLPVIFLASTNSALGAIWQALATFLGFTLSFPISTIAISLVYYDQRVRKEAFDLHLMMEAMGQGPQSQSAAAPIG
jgi:hypothetical protein